MAKKQVVADFVVGDSLDRMYDELLNFGLQVALLAQGSVLLHFFHPHQVLQTFVMLAQAQVLQIDTMGSSKRHFS